jgi:murein L,D-transpeptidase YcbB/YkuD
MEKGRIIESILSVQPGFVEYTRLQRAAAKFVKTNPLTDQWVELKQPVEDSAIFFRHIGEVLETLGYLDKHNRERDIPQALKSFQHFHGLEPDGKPGKNTIDALRQTTLYKYKILAMNLDRLRKEQIADSNQLLVNIPDYRLTIFEGNRMVDTFRVIVGHPASPTPLLTARMERIITNPVWYVPRSITMNEILPKLKTDSNYLRRNRMKLLDSNYKPVDEASVNLAAMDEGGFNYTLRQDRGSENSLGQVKFVFSNPYTIYLHDTPGKQMFFKDLRAFSHGCIRIKDPERLAGYIIRKINSGDTDVNTLITSGTHREIDITTLFPSISGILPVKRMIQATFTFIKIFMGSTARNSRSLNRRWASKDIPGDDSLCDCYY